MWKKKAQDLTVGESCVFTVVITGACIGIYGIVIGAYYLWQSADVSEKIGGFFRRLFSKKKQEDLCETVEAE